MRVFYSLDDLPVFNGSVVTVGSFDGVHRGHRALLDRVRAAAADRGESIVVTFSPHPRQVLARGGDVRLLNSLEEKIFLLEEAGIDNLVVIPFTPGFSEMSSEKFVADILVEKLGMKHFVVGFDHRFGHDQQGSSSSLAGMGREFGFSIEEVPAEQFGQSKVSSTEVRRAIAGGDVARASELLGRGYIAMGLTQDGKTVIIPDTKKLMPPPGSYGLEVRYAKSAPVHDTLEISENGELRLRGGKRDYSGTLTLTFVQTGWNMK